MGDRRGTSRAKTVGVTPGSHAAPSQAGASTGTALPAQADLKVGLYETRWPSQADLEPPRNALRPARPWRKREGPRLRGTALSAWADLKVGLYVSQGT